jgi:phthiocerol/phenolphthiocerol synthesis type-I polyketide synthase E
MSASAGPHKAPDPGLDSLDIAVVGLACTFPGAPDADAFWRNVRDGRQSISFLGSLGEGTPPGSGTAVAGAGVVDGAELFDASFFGYTPRDAELLDPQQRLFLECAWSALEDAGHCGTARSQPAGVYASASVSTYLLRHLLARRDVVEQVGEYELILGNDKDMLATRAAYHLDLRGPAITVQSACSSSLAAVHVAIAALIAGDCRLAVAGGVSVRPPQLAPPDPRGSGILSPDGTCRPFDERAAGTVGGNGVGVVVLRPLGDALRDGDHVRAVIKGSALTNDGAGKVGFVAPSAQGQAAAIRAAYQAADVPPATVGYVEAHGTATIMGDPVEFEALCEAFGADGLPPGQCALGSVKALIGHLDAAAGVAGLIKAILALENGTLPPSPYFRAPNPEIDLARSPFAVHREARPWPRLGAPRRAGVSSFGMGGTNAHVVLEEAPPPAAGRHDRQRPYHLVTLSAKTASALDSARERLRAHLASARPRPALGDVAHTLQRGRKAFSHRLAVVCPDDADWPELLAARSPAALTAVAAGAGRDVVFLFPGQGAQYAGMGAGLYQAEPAYRDAIDECAELLRPRLNADLRTLLMPPGPGRPAGDDPAAALDQTQYAQPAMFAVGYALAALWAQWGIRPRAMTGHSVGEYVAACLAGVFSLQSALDVVAMRGQLMQSLPPGAMLSVALPAGELAARLPAGTSIAASNARDLCVASGPAEPIEALARQLAAQDVRVRRLRTARAFHSPAMDPILDDLTAIVSQVRLSPPRIPFTSNLTGDWITDEQATSARYWADHARGRVRFADCLAKVTDDGPAVLLELGPGDTLVTLARRALPGQGHTAVASLPRPPAASAAPPAPGPADPELASVTTALGRLWLAGVDPDWDGYWDAVAARRVTLPAYPFERQPYWIEPPPAAAGQAPAGPAMPASRAPAAALTAEPAPDEGAGRRDGDRDSDSDGRYPRPGLATPYVAPRSSREEAIAAIWQVLLGIAPIGIHDNFFELGGHSLLATQVSARLRDVLGADLPAGAVMEAPTVAELAARAAEAAQDEPGPPGAAGADPDDIAELLAQLEGADEEFVRSMLEGNDS